MTPNGSRTRAAASTSATAALLLGGLLMSCSQPGGDSTGEVEIERGLVDRVITTLASDEMEGRAAFSAGIERAADFLVEEFDRIGLETLEGLDGFRQSFTVYSLTPENSDVVLNGEPVAASDFFFMAGAPQVSWSQEDQIAVTHISDGDDFADFFASSRRNPSSALVLVDPAHRDLFNRYRGFFSGSRRVLELSEGGTVVFVLTGAGDAESYRVELTTRVEEMPLANIAGKITGERTDELVLFSAHYDHIGIRTGAEGDSIANGANDDASGSTAVVALADYFMERRRPERTLLFVLFTAEESGGYGSQYFSRQLDPERIVAMFNIEMIGKPAVEGPNTAWITGFERSSFGEILQRAVEGSIYTFYPDPYPTQNLFFRSDNATLARLGVPAHSISTTPIDVDPDYHQVSDEVETLDLDHMTNTIAAIATAAGTIVSGEETPTRVSMEEQ